jgi:hypothetical protein
MMIQPAKTTLRQKIAQFFAVLLCAAPLAQAQAREIDLEKLKVPQNGQGVVLVSLTVSGLENQLYTSFAYHEPHEASAKAPQIVVGRPFLSSNETFSAIDRAATVSGQIPVWRFLCLDYAAPLRRDSYPRELESEI